MGTAQPAESKTVSAQASLGSTRTGDTDFHELLDLLPAAVYGCDASGAITHYNLKAVELWGRKPRLGEPDERFCGSLRLFTIEGECLPHDKTPMAQVLRTGRPARDQEVIIERPDGSRVTVLANIAPMRGGAGEIAGAVNCFIDVTSRKEAESARARLASIVESSEDAIVSETLDGIIVSWNQGAKRIFGYTADEVIGRPISILVPPERQDDMPRILDVIRRGERIRHFETQRVCKDGRRIHVSLSVSPIRDAGGRIVGASKIARDITSRKDAEEALRLAKDAAEQANRAKDDFLATLSHELRTPLSPVLMIARLLAEDERLPSDVRRDMQTVRQNIELETRLIDDLLDLTRIARGKIQLRLETVDVHQALNAALQTCRDDDSCWKRLEVRSEFQAGHPWVRADAARMGQVFWNLIKNAFKFTPEGGRVTLRTSNYQAGKVRVEVSDTGVGIEPSRLSLIFKAFEQGGAETTRQFGGLGLGLAICRAITELHGGAIHAFSDGPGTGATFTIELAAAERPAPCALLTCDRSLSGDRHPAGKRYSILLVEDHASTLEVLRRLLERWGYEACCASSVQSGLQAASNRQFDLVVSDLGLPDGSGCELMRQLQDRQGLRGIALSGYGMERDVQRSMEAGFVRHLTKPVDFDQLKATIAELVTT